MDSDPKFTVFILGITNSLLFLRLYIFSRSLKISFIKGGFILLCKKNVFFIDKVHSAFFPLLLPRNCQLHDTWGGALLPLLPLISATDFSLHYLFCNQVNIENQEKVQHQHPPVVLPLRETELKRSIAPLRPILLRYFTD